MRPKPTMPLADGWEWRLAEFDDGYEKWMDWRACQIPPPSVESVLRAENMQLRAELDRLKEVTKDAK